MKRLLSLVALIGIIFMVASPVGVLAAGEIVGYEFNKTSLDGWAFQDGTAIDSDNIQFGAINLGSDSGKFLKYTAVSDWGDCYTLSVDVDMSEWSTSDSYNGAIIYLESKSGGDVTYGYKIGIPLGNPNSNTLPKVHFQRRKSGGTADSMWTNADFTNAPEKFKEHVNDWHVEIEYNKGNIKVYMKPNNISYTGELFKVLDVTDPSELSGQIGLLNTISGTSTCRFGNLKITKNIEPTAYDYNWSGSIKDWTVTSGKFVATDGVLKAQNCNYGANNFAVYDAVTWSGNVTVKCHVNCAEYGDGGTAIYFGRDAGNWYKLRIQDGDSLSLARLEAGSTASTLGNYTATTNTYFHKGTFEMNCNKGTINVWYTPDGGTRTQIFTNLSDTSANGAYTSGIVALSVHTSTTAYFKNISISGDFTASNSICNGQVIATEKLANGQVTTVDFSGLDMDAPTGNMSLRIPVRYAAASGNTVASVFVAYYNSDDVMLDVDMEKAQLSSENREWIEVPVNAELPSGTSKVRCFVWNASSLNPAMNMSHAN